MIKLPGADHWPEQRRLRDPVLEHLVPVRPRRSAPSAKHYAAIWPRLVRHAGHDIAEGGTRDLADAKRVRVK